LSADRAGLAAVDSGGQLTVVNTADGKVRWTAAGADPFPRAANGMIVAPGDGSLTAYDDRTGKVRWRAASAGPLSPAVIGDVVVAVPGSIPDRSGIAGYALDGGTTRWQSQPLGDVDVESTTAGIIVRTTVERSVRFIDAATGKERWHAAQVPAWMGQAVATKDALVTVETDGRPGQVVFRSLTDGRVTSTVPVSGGVSVVTAMADGSVYVATSTGRDNELVALREGRVAWRAPLLAAPTRPVAATADGGVVAQVFDPMCATLAAGSS
jgi:outer membrane protein assembly factor BamB